MKAQYPDRGTSRLRSSRVSTPGAYYFVTTRTFDGRRTFDNPACVRVLFDSLDWLESRGAIELHFAVAMPDHIHLVFCLSGSRSLPQVMKSLKGFSSRRMAAETGIECPVWQDGYHEHQVRSDESLNDIISYCRHNPVRSGLAAEPADYPHFKSRGPLGD